MLRYKVVECSLVTDEALEEIINEWVKRGWEFDRIAFAMRESSKRPAMAFVIFYREDKCGGEEGGAGFTSKS